MGYLLVIENRSIDNRPKNADLDVAKKKHRRKISALNANGKATMRQVEKVIIDQTVFISHNGTLASQVIRRMKSANFDLVQNKTTKVRNGQVVVDKVCCIR